jgi:hypothetical protein
VYKNQQSRQTGSRNPMGSKTLPTIWGTYMKLVTKYQISAMDPSDSYFLFADFVDFSTHWTYMLIFRFWTRQIPTSCLPKSGGIIGGALAHSSSCCTYSIFLSPSYDSQLSICFHLSWKFRCSGNLSLFVSVIPDSSGSTTCPCRPLKKHYFLLIFRNWEMKVLPWHHLPVYSAYLEAWLYIICRG